MRTNVHKMLQCADKAPDCKKQGFSNEDFLVHRLADDGESEQERRTEKGVGRGEGYDQAVFLQDSSGGSRWDRLRVGAPSVNSQHSGSWTKTEKVHMERLIHRAC